MNPLTLPQLKEVQKFAESLGYDDGYICGKHGDAASFQNNRSKISISYSNTVGKVGDDYIRIGDVIINSASITVRPEQAKEFMESYNNALKIVDEMNRVQEAFNDGRLS